MDRRTFVNSLVMGGCALTFAQPRKVKAAEPLQLLAVKRTIEVNGKAASVFGLVGPDGKHGLSLEAGATSQVALNNQLDEATMIHWHGLTPQWRHDGVPDMPLPMLKPGEVRGYELPGGQPGTHWMHAHTLQEQNLLAAPLIVRGKDDLTRDEHEIVVLLHDFSFTPAEELLGRLKSGGGMGHGMGQGMGGGMMMDLNDIAYDAYLANDRTLDDPEVHRVEKGGRVLLRIINGATATGFTIDTGVLAGEVIAVDGQDVVPFATRQVPLAMGQRVDIRLAIPKDGGAFPVLALREGAPERTGIIIVAGEASITRLAANSGVPGPVLSLDLEARLTSLRPLAATTPARRFAVNLYGNMMGYSWGMESNLPLRVQQGERAVIIMRNHSMMSHPMHLHGHHFQVMAINGRAIEGALRDTVLVPPMAAVAFAFDANNAGEHWAFHCHHLYHMASGMMAMVGYEGV